MKNTSFFEQVKCIIRDCDRVEEPKSEIQAEEIETKSEAESSSQGFQPFDIDEVFAN